MREPTTESRQELFRLPTKRPTLTNARDTSPAEIFAKIMMDLHVQIDMR